MDGSFSNSESFSHYSILGAGCQLVKGNGNPLSGWNRWSGATCDWLNIGTNESTQHLKRRPCHSKMLQPETFCKVSLHRLLPEGLIACGPSHTHGLRHIGVVSSSSRPIRRATASFCCRYFVQLQLFVKFK